MPQLLFNLAAREVGIAIARWKDNLQCRISLLGLSTSRIFYMSLPMLIVVSLGRATLQLAQPR